MSDDDKIIPFGKYKGQEIVQVMARDPQYVQWLTQQAWFGEKFAPIYQVIINQFAPPSEDTPAHNAMQVRFLEEGYRAAFWRVADLVGPDVHEHLLRTFRENTKGLCRAPKPFQWRRQMRGPQLRDEDAWTRRLFEQHRREVSEQWQVWRTVRNERLPVAVSIGKPRFEGVTDVIFPVTLSLGVIALAAIRHFHLAALRTYRLGIEIKPCVGDDYPAVLRQIKQQKIAARMTDELPSFWFLLIGEFSASNVTLDQVRQIFAQDDIRVVLASEILP